MLSDQALAEAAVHLADLRRRDPDISSMVAMVLDHEGHSTIAEFARDKPAEFEGLYDAALAMVGLDDEMERYLEARGSKAERVVE